MIRTSAPIIITILALFAWLLVSPGSIQANETSKMGVHILQPEEVVAAKQLMQIEGNSQSWHYVTIPFTINDLNQPERWQKFFAQAEQQQLIPLVRLSTKMEDNGWAKPSRKNIVDQLNALSSYDWPTNKKHIIIFNEVNHAKEWGGSINPEEYAHTFRFASNWAHSIDDQFVVMPAAMDLAAPNGPNTMEAFAYLDRMQAFDEEIFSYADAWNSHSYPNPGFSASPERSGKNALNGFEYELDYLANKTDEPLPVFITETGWEENSWLRPWLPAYYTYAMQHVWSDPRVVGVTPFILKGAPGPFADFSFLNQQDQPTMQYNAFRSAMERLQQAELPFNTSE